MKEQFVTYEIAIALKELGFDEPCFAHYNNDLIIKQAILKSSSMLYYQQDNINPNNQYGNNICTAPLWQQVIDWFREKHKLSLEFKTSFYKRFPEHSCFITYTVAGTYSSWLWKGGAMTWSDYYEMREQAILKAIELIKS